MKGLLTILLVLLVGCTPTVKEVALNKNKNEVVVLKRGKFGFSEEERRFIREEAHKLNIEIPRKEAIRREMERLLKNKQWLEVALRRASLYIPHITPILREYGLPEELALLPLIESGFNPFAVSHSGAGGIWQLMPATARSYGLKVNSHIDERFDLVKSTHAAAKYLRDLYNRFGDWSLVLAAYNCGEGCVSRRTGGVDFWRSKWALPEQTRRYVPMFFASLLIARSPQKYGLRVKNLPLNLEKTIVERDTEVKNIVKKLKLKESTFRDMNPHIRGEVVPAGTFLYIPSGVYKEKRKAVVKLTEPERGRKQLRKAPKSKKVVIKEPEKPSPRKVKVIRLENGALLYIKE
ncbi:MAG: lytic transglycosylase domain-containing protein [Aquificae bacterium]|nr:lytic transglycosylase domain-containing protein [Aquificota bacterium]